MVHTATDIGPILDQVPLGSFDFWGRPPHERAAGFTALREHAPVAFHTVKDLPGVTEGDGFWAVTRYQDIHAASRQLELSNNQGVLISDMISDPMMTNTPPAIIAMDDPEHARLRSLVNRGFTPRAVSGLADSVRQTVREVVDSVIERGACDFVEDVAAAIPLRVICTMMGIDESRYKEIYTLTNAIVGGEDPEYAVDSAARVRANLALTEYGEQLAAEKLAHPGDDLASLLVSSAQTGERISPNELASFFKLLVAAGNETTRNAITQGLYLLTTNPEQRQAWMSDFDGLAPSAVEEILRVASPLNSMRRTAAEDTTVAGQAVSKGDKVVLFYASANRDHTIFENPDQFNIRRDPNPHMAFGGGGAHFCLGAHLAKLELKIVFEELFTRMPDIRTVEEPDYLKSTFVNGIKRVRAEWSI